MNAQKDLKVGKRLKETAIIRQLLCETYALNDKRN